MKIVKVLKVDLNEKEEHAIEIVVHMLKNMWEQPGDYEMGELWETYGSNEENGWICIEDTLRNLLNGGK